MPTLLTGTNDYATAVATSATSLACNKPTNTADGDLLIAYALFRNTAGTITPPSGWTVVNAAESTVFTEAVYYKTVPTASAETATSYTFSYSGSTARVAIIIARVTGANLSSPIQVAGAWTTGSAGTVTYPSLTATAAGQYIAAFARNNGSAGDATETWGGSLVQALATTAGTTAITEIFFAQETISGAGATGTRTANTSAQTATAGQSFIISSASHTSPTANAGSAQTVAPSTLTTLSGSGTAFDSATITGYTWSIVSAPGGSSATLSSTSAQNPTITPVVPGTYTFGLVVTDSLGATSSQATTTVTVTGYPVFVAGGTAYATSTTAVADLPAGIANHDIAILKVSSDSSGIGPASAGWLPIGTVFSGGGLNHRLWYRRLDGTEGTGSASTVVSSITGGTKGISYTTVYRPVDSSKYLYPTVSQGADSDSSSTAFSVTGASMTTAANDLLVAYVDALAATGTFSAVMTGAALTQATMGTLVQRRAARTGTNTISYGTWERPITTGATATPAFTATAVGDNATGLGSFIRIREAANTAPTANAGPDQSGITTGTLVTLDGTGSTDPEGEGLTYAWTKTSGPTATLSSSTAAQPTFTPASAGTYVYSLTVTDNLGSASSADSVSITVTASATVNAGPDQSGIEPWNTTVTLAGTSSNGTYAWTQTAGTTVTLSSTSVAGPTFTAPAGLTVGETLTFQLSNGAGQTDTVNIAILPAVEFWFNGTSQVPTYWRVWNGTTWV